MTSAIKNYTTDIAASVSLGEIQGLLAQMGARRIQVEYIDGYPDRLAFSLPTNRGVLSYALPANVKGVQATLQRDGVRSGYQTMGHARMVAWRILKDWVSAQLAMTDAGMVLAEEVMLPYQITESGETLYQLVSSGMLRLLPASTGA